MGEAGIPASLPFRTSALDHVYSIERTVNNVPPMKKKAGQCDHFAAAVGCQRPGYQRHRHVQEDPGPPAPGDQKQVYYDLRLFMLAPVTCFHVLVCEARPGNQLSYKGRFLDR